MTRTVAREIAVQIGFSLADKPENAEEALDNFFDKEYYDTLADENELFAEYPTKKQREYMRTVVTGVAEHIRELDERIEKHAKGWKLSRISRIALVILRTAMFEVLFMDDIPDSVAINEAVELAKGYEEQETVSFINGILGSFMRAERGTEVSADLREEDAEFSQEAAEPAAEEKPITEE